jgi:type I restriction enzyme S subunit
MAVKPGYKQTEVGVIPEEWELKDFDTLGNVIDGDRGVQYPSGSDFSDSGDCLFLNAGNVTKVGFRFVECAFITHEKDSALNKGKLKRNDIVLTTRGTIGNWAYFGATVPFENMRINSGMVILRNASASLDTGFLYAFLQSRLVELQIERLTFGSAQPQLTVRDINKFEVVVPPIPEQHAIATALSDVDALLDALERLIAKKRELKQGSMQQLLTGQTRLPGFQGEWEVVSAGEVGRFRGGNGFPLISQGEAAGKYPFFKVSDMNNEGNETFMTVANHCISEKTHKQLGATVFPAGSIVFAKVGAAIFLERKKILGQPSCIDNNMTALVLDSSRADVRYVHTLFLTIRLGSLVSTTALPSLNGKQLSEIVLNLPPLTEQTAIAAVLSDMDAELTALEQRLAKTRALKQGMMQELLTGRTRLL